MWTQTSHLNPQTMTHPRKHPSCLQQSKGQLPRLRQSHLPARYELPQTRSQTHRLRKTHWPARQSSFSLLHPHPHQ